MATPDESTCESLQLEEVEAREDDTVIVGGGASLPANLYADILFAYGLLTSQGITYTSMGSSKGICRIKSFCENCKAEDTRQPTVLDFAGSDALLTEEDYLQFGDLQMVPSVTGAVVPVFNLHHVGISELVLSMPVLGQIFRSCDASDLNNTECIEGSIQSWDDERIVALNPDAEGKLKKAGKITVVVRKDGSGTTEIFKKSLAKFEPTFATQIGTSSAPEWPGADVIYANLNVGIVATVSSHAGSIGYSVLSEALNLDIGIAGLVKQPGGPVVTANVRSVSAATTELGSSYNLYTTGNGSRKVVIGAEIAGATGPYAWPIAGNSFFVLRMETLVLGSSCEKRARLLDFFEWYYADNVVERIAEKHGFATIPPEMKVSVLETLRKDLLCNSFPVYRPKLPLKLILDAPTELHSILDTTTSVYEIASSKLLQLELQNAPKTVQVELSEIKPFLVRDHEDLAVMMKFGFRDNWVDAEQLHQSGQLGLLDIFGYGWGVITNVDPSLNTVLSPSCLAGILSGAIQTWNHDCIILKDSASQERLTLSDDPPILLHRVNEDVFENRFQAVMQRFVADFEMNESVGMFHETVHQVEVAVLARPWSIAVIPLFSRPLLPLAIIDVGSTQVTFDLDGLTYPFRDAISVAFPVNFTGEECKEDANELAIGREFGKFVHWLLGKEMLATPIVANGMSFLPDDAALEEIRTSVKCNGEYVMKPTMDLQLVPTAFKAMALLLASLSLILCAVLAVYMFKMRHTRVIRITSWSFAVQIVLGVAVSLSTVFPLLMDDKPVYDAFGQSDPIERELRNAVLNRACRAQPFLFCLGYGMIFTPLLLRSWRINSLWTQSIRPRSKRLQVSYTKLLALEFLVLGIMLAILISWDQNAQLRWERVVLERDLRTGLPVRSGGRCVSENVWRYLVPMLGFVFLTLIFGNYLAFKGRKLPVEFGEAKYNAIAMANFLECFVLCIPILLLTHQQPNVDVMVKVIFIILVNLGTLVILFGQKVFYAWNYGQFAFTSGETGISGAKTSVHPSNPRSGRSKASQYAGRVFSSIATSSR